MARGYGKVRRRKGVNPRNGRDLRPRERMSTVNRAEGRRSRYDRCPLCKKLRMKWMLANMWWSRVRWERFGGQRVCHICVARLLAKGDVDVVRFKELNSGL